MIASPEMASQHTVVCGFYCLIYLQTEKSSQFGPWKSQAVPRCFGKSTGVVGGSEMAQRGQRGSHPIAPSLGMSQARLERAGRAGSIPGHAGTGWDFISFQPKPFQDPFPSLNSQVCAMPEPRGMDRQENRDGERSKATSEPREASGTLMLLRLCSMVRKVCFFLGCAFRAASGAGLEPGEGKGQKSLFKMAKIP